MALSVFVSQSCTSVLNLSKKTSVYSLKNKKKWILLKKDDTKRLMADYRVIISHKSYLRQAGSLQSIYSVLFLSFHLRISLDSSTALLSSAM